MRILKKGQVWSTDLIVAVIIFLVILAIFYTVMTNKARSPREDLEQQSDFIAAKLDKEKSTNPYAVFRKNELDRESIDFLYNASYGELKRYFNIQGDFCIYLEDSEGYLLVWEDSAGNKKTAQGNGTINVSYTPCGEHI
ncbi:MAG: hypothetical protein ABIE94_06310 [archaeon]